MPIIARTLIEGRSIPVSVKSNDSLQKAVELMVEHDFTQLPIIDDSDRPLGLVTIGSVLQGMTVLGGSLEKLQVRDVTVKHQAFYYDDDIFDILDSLNSNSAILIVDSDEKLQGIVTNWDTAAYFRRRSQDMMLVEDIELALREHILAAFMIANDKILDENSLQQEIDSVVNMQILSNVRSAVGKYLAQLPEKPKPDNSLIEIASEGLVKRGMQLNKLTLHEEKELLARRWDTYGKHFNLKVDDLKSMLSSIGTIRNILAHFRDEITPTQRNDLRFYARWFEQNSPVYPQIEAVTDTLIPTPEIVLTESSSVEIVAVDEEIDPEESRYTKLADYLQGTSIERDFRLLSFREIEGIIGGELPPSARQHRSWWANDSKSHVQSRQWLDVGWRVSSINMTLGNVTFARIGDRARMYIDFFSQLLNELKEKIDFPIRNAPDGTNWHYIGSYKNAQGNQIALLAFTFARGNRFRVELYIDAGEKERNKEIFDSLYYDREHIESNLLPMKRINYDPEYPTQIFMAFDGEIRWERLDNKRASRFAIYHEGSIENDKSELETLRLWAVEAMILLHRNITYAMEAHKFKYRA